MIDLRPQPKVNANVSMPASRNSISNRRSAIGLDCRIVRLATTAASDSRSIPHTAPVCNSGLASRRSKRGIEASATIRTVAWSTARARLRFEFSKGSRRAVPSSPREDCCCPGETDARGQYQELKSELGLDHFEARTYPGWQHHVVLTAVAHAYIQHERMRRGSAALTFPAVRAVVQEIFTVLLFAQKPRYMQWMEQAKHKVQLRI